MRRAARQSTISQPANKEQVAELYMDMTMMYIVDPISPGGGIQFGDWDPDCERFASRPLDEAATGMLPLFRIQRPAAMIVLV